MTRRFSFVLFSVVLFFASCDDLGDPVTPPSHPAPVITSITPDSAAIGDTVRIDGANFSSTIGTVTFGAVAADTILTWTDIMILVKVPAGTVSGSVLVTANGMNSNTVAFNVGTVTLVSFSSDILPLFTGPTYGCTGCHGGQNNLFLDTYNGVLSGNAGYSTAAASNNGPVIIPGNAASSILVRKLRSNTLPFGARMPQGGGQVTDDDLKKITDWINQGALNN